MSQWRGPSRPPQWQGKGGQPAQNPQNARPQYQGAPQAGPSWQAPPPRAQWQAPPQAGQWQAPPQAGQWQAPPPAAQWQAPQRPQVPPSMHGPCAQSQFQPNSGLQGSLPGARPQMPQVPSAARPPQPGSAGGQWQGSHAPSQGPPSPSSPSQLPHASSSGHLPAAALYAAPSPSAQSRCPDVSPAGQLPGAQSSPSPPSEVARMPSASSQGFQPAESLPRMHSASTMVSTPSDVPSFSSQASEPTMARSLKRRFTQRRLPQDIDGQLQEFRVVRKSVARAPPKLRPEREKAQFSHMIHFALYPHLRRTVWANGVAWLLFVCGCLSSAPTYWFSMEPLPPPQDGSLTEGFPYAAETFGPQSVWSSEDFTGMPLTVWVAEACSPKKQRDLVAWLMFLERKVQPANASAQCVDEAGVWCRHWRESQKDQFRELCQNSTAGAMLRRNCQLTCELCKPSEGLAEVILRDEDGQLPEYLRREMEVWCSFRTAVHNRMWWGKVAVWFSAVACVIIPLLLYFFRWNAHVVLLCVCLQILSCAWFGSMFLWMSARKGAVPDSAVTALKQHFAVPVLEDQLLTKVHDHFIRFYDQPVRLCVEANLAFFGVLAQIFALLNCAAWYMKLQGLITGKLTVTGFTIGALLYGLVLQPMRWYWACMDKIFHGAVDTYSAKQYGRNAEHPGWPNKYLGRRVDYLFGIPLPKIVGRILGDVRSLLQHYMRIYESDGFLEENKITSEAEEDDLKRVGVTCRSLQNIFAWRRSVLVCAVAYGIFLLPIGAHDIHEVLLRRRGTMEALQWPEDWDAFHDKFGNSPYAVNATTGLRREATKQDYLGFMIWKLLALVHQLGSSADVWLVIIAVFIEWLAFACALLGLVSWLWWASSKRLALISGALLVYAPIALSLVPRGRYVVQDSWTGIDIFLLKVGNNVFKQSQLEGEVAQCWDRIGTGLWDTQQVAEVIRRVCKLFLGIVSKTDGDPAKGTNTTYRIRGYGDVTGPAGTCVWYDDYFVTLENHLKTTEASARSVCAGMQRHQFDDMDPSLETAHPVKDMDDLLGSGSPCGDFKSTQCYNSTLLSMLTSKIGEAESSTKQANQVVRRVLSLYAGGRAGVMTFLDLVPTSISIIPAVLAAAWRVRLVMPLSRLPTIIIMTLPWIYCPILWTQFLWFWQLMSSPTLLVALVIICFGFFQWIITSFYFRITDPIPPEQLNRAMRKQAYCDYLLFSSGWVLMLIWLLLDNREKSSRVRNFLVEYLSSWSCLKLFTRVAFKFLVTRVLAMDFIITQMSHAHYFELGLQAMQKESEAHSKRASYAAEIDDGLYGEAAAQRRRFELLAIADVLELVDSRHDTLDSLVDLEHRMSVESAFDGKSKDKLDDDLNAIEMSSQSQIHQPHHAAAPTPPQLLPQMTAEQQPYMYSDNWAWQQWGTMPPSQNFDALIREFQSAYRPPQNQHHYAYPPPPHYPPHHMWR